MNNVIRLSMLAALAMLAATEAQASISKEPQIRSESIRLSGLSRVHSWKAVSRNEIILWTSPFKTYLVTLQTPFNGLRFTQAIGVTTTAGRVGRFDSILADGRRLPIQSIVAIDRDAAKSMKWRTKEDDI